eukprot:UC4_evm1s911
MNAASLNPTEIILQHEQDVGYSGFGSGAGMGAGVYIPDNVSAYKLTSNDRSSEDSTVLRVFLNQKDLNALKRMEGLGTSNANTWIAMTSKTAMDMNGNALVPIDDDNAMQAFAVVKDETPPQLEAFDLDMNLGFGRLVLSFSDFSLVSCKNCNDQESVRLSPIETSILPSDGLSIVIKLSYSSSSSIKSESLLGTSQSTSYGSISPDFILDKSSNFVSESVIRARHYTPDKTMPRATKFDIDLNSSTLSIQFDEVVREAGNDVYDSFALKNGTTVFKLSSGVMTSVGDTVSIAVNEDDLNTIKGLPLCSGISDCFLSIQSGAWRDSVDNPVIGVELPVSKYSRDKQKPKFQGFDFDLNKGKMSLSFDETMDADSLVFGRVTLASFKTLANSKSSITLGTGSVMGNDGLVVEFAFSKDDLDAIKTDTSLCTDISDCWLSLDSGAYLDMSQNILERVSSIYPVKFKPDTTSPELEKFDFDYNLGNLKLYFSEPVLASSVTPSRIVLQHDVSSSAPLSGSVGSFALSSAVGKNSMYVSSVSDQDSDIITISLGKEDILMLKSLYFATDPKNTYLTISSDGAKDMAYPSPNSLDPVLDGNAMKVSNYTGDVTAPILLAHSVDLNTNVVSMTFNEPMQYLGMGSSLMPTVTLTNDQGTTILKLRDTRQDVSLEQRKIAFKCWVGPVLDETCDNSVKDGLSKVHFQMDPRDGKSLKSMIKHSGSITAAFKFFDMAGNEGSARESLVYKADIRAASLMQFSLNMSSGTLKLTFDDAVDTASTLDLSGIAICPYDKNVASDCRTLTEQSALLSPSAGIYRYEVNILLAKNDLNALKQNKQVATNSSNTFLSLQPYFVQDIEGTNIIGIPHETARAANIFIPDLLRTFAKSFDLDMNEGIITIEFPEAMDKNTINISKAYMGSKLNDEMIQLTTPYGVETFQFSSQLILRLNNDDLNNIKNLHSTIFSSNFTLKLSSGFVSDFEGNPLLTTTLEQSSHQQDKKAPSLESFSLDMDEGLMELSFDESVDAKTFNASHIIVQDASHFISHQVTLHDGTPIKMKQNISKVTAGIASSHRLKDGNAAPNVGPVLTFRLLKADLDSIKANINLATSEANTYLLIDGIAIRDMEGNPVTEIKDGDAKKIKAGGFTPDETKPELESFTVDLNPSITLNLVFSEPVYATNINVSKMMLQNGVSGPGKSIEMHPINADATFSKDFSTNVAVELSTSDVNAVKAVLDLFTTTKDSFLSIADGFVTDMNSQPLVVIGASEAKNATMVIVDSTRPSLVSFEMDMNVEGNNANITLRFDET